MRSRSVPLTLRTFPNRKCTRSTAKLRTVEMMAMPSANMPE